MNKTIWARMTIAAAIVIALVVWVQYEPSTRESQVILEVAPLSEGIQILTPKSGDEVSAMKGIHVDWKFTDPRITADFSSDSPSNTFIELHIIASDGRVIGAIGDGFKFDQTSIDWPILSYLEGNFFKLSSEEKYKIRATILYVARYSCDPLLSTTKYCHQLYTSEEQELLDRSKTYRAESGWFTFDLSGYRQR